MSVHVSAHVLAHISRNACRTGLHEESGSGDRETIALMPASPKLLCATEGAIVDGHWKRVDKGRLLLHLDRVGQHPATLD